MINVRILKVRHHEGDSPRQIRLTCRCPGTQGHDKPPVKDDEVLVRVHAASVHPDVWHVVRGLPYVLRLMGAGLLRPINSVPGTDVAGHVESVGRDLMHFQAGDEVFGQTIKGYQWTNGGAYGEYVSVAERSLALKPANITFEQAAAVPTSLDSSPCTI
jgi:NADPH:quinone reductase-like Zn-dependent oxidoreductase